MNKPKKSLGQHWLHDIDSLNAMCEAGLVHEHDVVLEVGPGLGTLTELLVENAQRVIAVEYDNDLACELPQRVKATNLEVFNEDIMQFDLTKLPKDYKVVANIPYYLTSNLLRTFCESSNPPKIIALLVQKEVAERVAAGPGGLSILGVTTQMFYAPHLEDIVPASLFTPPPKVDSQIVQLLRRPEPLFGDRDEKQVFRVVKAGFSNKRKTLHNSLSAGLNIPKDEIKAILDSVKIDSDTRAQALSLKQWISLFDQIRL